MSEKCAGCTNKYGFFERPSVCPECHRGFCQTCLPYRGKKVKKHQPQVSLEPCVYCRKQKDINKSEEAEIMSNFQERFYKKTHTQPPIQSKLRLDLVMKQQGDLSPAQQQQQQQRAKGVELSEEGKAIEERLMKLREPLNKGKGVAPSPSEEEMRERLERLRDEEGGGDGGGAGVGSGGPDVQTQVGEADKLLEKAADEVRIDSNRQEMEEDELFKRFQALRGMGKGSTAPLRDNNRRKPGGGDDGGKLGFDMDQLVRDIDDSILEEDPALLFGDLKDLQHREEGAALKELQSGDVQQLIKVAQDLAKEEAGSGRDGEKEDEGVSDPVPDIVYPTFEETPRGDSGDKGSDGEVEKMMAEGREDLKRDEQRQEADSEFREEALERLKQLRKGGGGGGGGDASGNEVTSHEQIPEDEVVVKSKPKSSAASSSSSADARHNLQFAWSHFGARGVGGGTNSSRGGQPNHPGNHPPPLDDSEDFDDEVQQLIAQTLEEAELDRRLEASGLTTQQDEGSGGHQSGNQSSNTTSAISSSASSATPTQAQVGGAASTSAAAAAIGIGDADLPWCCICNDDATICCYDCDGDLYCQRCFSDGHQQFGLVDHQYTPFHPAQTKH